MLDYFSLTFNARPAKIVPTPSIRGCTESRRDMITVYIVRLPTHRSHTGYMWDSVRSVPKFLYLPHHIACDQHLSKLQSQLHPLQSRDQIAIKVS